MKIISWNVNGIKACWTKGLKEFIESSDADVLCFQETKVQEIFTPLLECDYEAFWSFADKKGYSGTVCLSKIRPVNVTYGIENPDFDGEGRVITLEFEDFYLVNAYVPNSKGSMQRFYYRLDWDEAFQDYLFGLKLYKPVIACGDFNVAHLPIDVYPENLRAEVSNVGFLDEERDGFTQILDLGFVDAYREIYPSAEGQYTWWSSRLNKRNQNRGWRIDYFVVDSSIKEAISDVGMYREIYGSDHCPIYLEVFNES